MINKILDQCGSGELFLSDIFMNLFMGNFFVVTRIDPKINRR